MHNKKQNGFSLSVRPELVEGYERKILCSYGSTGSPRTIKPNSLCHMQLVLQQKGFSLISIIVYTALATLLISLLMRTSIQFYPQLSGCGKSATEYLKICAAVDRIAHDIYSAPHDITQWKDVESGKIKFKQGEKTVGWYCKNKKLIRLERIFEKQKKNWKKKAKSVAADSVDNIIFNVHTLGSYVTGLTITLESKHAGNPICINRIIAVRTGVDR